MRKDYDSISSLAIAGIEAVYAYLGKEFIWHRSSIVSPNTQGMDKADRLIQITKDMGYTNYVNAIGGTDLYDKKYFTERGVTLQFVKSKMQVYYQGVQNFIPGLSIIDVLMSVVSSQ